MSVRVAEDRSLVVRPDQTVSVEWVPIDRCTLTGQMSPEAVEKKYRKLLQHGDSACWPPLLGHWQGETMVIDDGRHEYVASLMLGRREVLVATLVER